MKPKFFIIVISLLGLATFCSAADPAIEKAIRELDAQWAATVSTKDVDKLVAYYASNAVVLPPNKAAATTPAAIRAAWKPDLDGLVSGGWKADRVEVSKSGDMAWVTGTYDWVAKGPNGKTVTDKGKYLEVFAKQADGSWKCTADAWNSDSPAPPEEKK